MFSEESELIKHCKANNHKAFKALYKKYYRVLLGIALRFSKHKEEAEDILQESFIKIFHSINLYNGVGSFEGWLKRIVHNTAINSYKSNLKFNLYIDVDNEDITINDNSFNTIFNTIENKEVLKILNDMPDGYRVTLNLYCIDGYTHKEISEMLGISEGTSKSQLHKAKKYLKNILDKQHNQLIA